MINTVTHCDRWLINSYGALFMNDNIHIMPMLVLRGVVVFPGMLLHFDVGRKKSVRAINRAMQENQIIFLASQRDVTIEDPEFSDVSTIGCVAYVKQILKLPGDNLRVLVEGIYRAAVSEVISSEPYFTVAAEACVDKYSRASELRKTALVRMAKETFDEYVSLSDRLSPDVVTAVMADDNPGHLADYIASNLPMPVEDKQFILDQLSPVKRIEQLIVILRRECEILRLDNEINRKVQGNIDENQREYYLREQLKVLSEELGNNEDESAEVDEYNRSISLLKAPDEIKDKLFRETEKLLKMPQGSHEATVIRGYLDKCIALPWQTYSKDVINLQKAEKILEHDHYGMKKVKQRIIEMLAVKKLAPDVNGQIICLVGPPGVGKTSIAASIARCMGRKYTRISLGGIKDEAEIRGHRKTYIGAMEGRIMSAIEQAGTSNPLMLLDEIDKIGTDFKGDCSAALLEALDPEQNTAFRDHYIDLPYDLSHVLFITTANDADNIPAPLLDRMEIIELPSYTREDKFNIARRHLVAKQLKKHGLTAKTCRICDDAVYGLIDYYTREAGVRKLEQKIAALCRKAAAEIASGNVSSVVIHGKDLEKMLGVRRYRAEQVSVYPDEVGVVNGLAWTSVGGELLRIEVAALDGTGKIVLTGSLGDVMKESAQTAVSYIRSRAKSLGIDGDFYKNKDIHIHAVEAAVPKDGPSAGISMATAIASAMTGRPIRHDVAMTGEISLRGRVLPIGGLKEKTMAAYRAGIRTVIVPRENEPDLTEIDPRVHEALNFVIADNMDTVLETALIPAGADEDKPTAKIIAPVQVKAGAPASITQ
jgi:ATP-dependent Lon protease